MESSGFECYCEKGDKKCQRLDCGDDEDFLWFELVTDKYPEHIGYQIFDSNKFEQFVENGEFVTNLKEELDPDDAIENGYYNFNWSKWHGLESMSTDVKNEYRLVSFSTCVPKDVCVTAQISDGRDWVWNWNETSQDWDHGYNQNCLSIRNCPEGGNCIVSQDVETEPECLPGIRAPGRVKIEFSQTDEGETITDQREMKGDRIYNWYYCYFGSSCLPEDKNKCFIDLWANGTHKAEYLG